MQRVALLVLLVAWSGLLGSHAAAQVNVDSLKHVLPQLPADSMRLMALFRIGNGEMEQGRFTEARDHLRSALELARRLGDRKREDFAHGDMGNSYYYQGYNDSALTQWELALALAYQRSDTGYANAIRMNTANAYVTLGRSDEAQRIYLDVLRWAETHGSKEDALNSLVNLAVLYALQDKPDSTINYYRRVLREFSGIGPPYTQAAVLNNMGQAFLDLGRVDSAAVIYTRLMAFSRNAKLGSMIASAHTGLGNVAMRRGDRFVAHDHFQEAVQLYGNAGSADEQAVDLERLATLAREAVEQGDRTYLQRYFAGSDRRALAQAHTWLDSAITTFQQVEDPDNLRSAYSAISEVERAQGDYKAALGHYQLFKAISDTLLNAERDKKLTERAMQYAFDKKQAAEEAEQRIKDESHAYALQRERVRRNILIAAGLVAIVFGSISYRQRRRTQKALERSDELLLNILPEEVADELKERGTAQARHFDTATILFTDFKGFTQLSEQVSPAELVEELNRCFKAFDEVMVRYRIEKIKTIGDAYMAAGGLPDPRNGAPVDVVHAALEMQDFMARYKAERTAAGRPYFEMRVGIHSGPVVAGIVGVKKFQYDIWGDTVNTASRMESSGEVGRVNISSDTYRLVRDAPGLAFTARGKVAAKGKGDLEMFFVESGPNAD